MHSNTPDIELSIIMPCLDEADTLAICIGAAQATIESKQLEAEIIVADNGSTDASRAIAESLGARLVSIDTKGYGSALMGGIQAARGKFVVMADADASYDFGELPKFLDRLREGFDVVQGCRLPSGGGRVLPGAMPFLHRWWGNPMFSLLARKWFHLPLHDVNCGMRGFTKAFYSTLDQRCLGMEFAVEMLIKARLHNGRMTEVPITLHPDQRTSHPPHLRTFRDGWRTLRFYLVYSPRWLFLIPGIALIIFGLVGYGIAGPGMRIRGIHFDVHTLLFSSLFIICGYQAVLFAFFTKIFAISEGLLPPDPLLERAFRWLTLEVGLVIGFASGVTGLVLLLEAFRTWQGVAFGDLAPQVTMRLVIPGMTLSVLGFEMVLSSFFLSILGMRRK